MFWNKIEKFILRVQMLSLDRPYRPLSSKEKVPFETLLHRDLRMRGTQWPLLTSWPLHRTRQLWTCEWEGAKSSTWGCCLTSPLRVRASDPQHINSCVLVRDTESWASCSAYWIRCIYLSPRKIYVQIKIWSTHFMVHIWQIHFLI